MAQYTLQCVDREWFWHQVTVSFHLDDLLIDSVSSSGIKSLEDCLTKLHNEVTFVLGDNHPYLSMSINCSNKEFWEIDMNKCLVGKEFSSTTETNCPSSDNLFRVVDEQNDVALHSKTVFHTSYFLLNNRYIDCRELPLFLCQ